MTDSMKKAFNDAVEKIENVYEDVDRIRVNVNIEAKTVFTFIRTVTLYMLRKIISPKVI